MITQTSIQEYLATVAEQASRLPKVIVAEDIPLHKARFNQVKMGNFDNIAMSHHERHLSDNIDTICKSIQVATDTPQVLVSAEPLLEEWDNAEIDDILANVLADAVDATLDHLPVSEALATIEKEPMRWINDQLVGSNPWEIFEGFESAILGSPACNMILEALFKNCEWIEHDEPALTKMAERVITICDDQLRHIENKSGLRAADIYRHFSRPMVWIYHHLAIGRDTLDDLLLSQSLPFAELDNPDWIDSYTGEVDPQAKEDRIRFSRSLLKSNTEEEYNAEHFSEGFDALDGLDEVFDLEDDRGVDEKVWKAAEQDYAPTSDLPFLRSEAYPLVKACRKLVSDCMKLFKETAPKWQENPWGGISPVNPDIYAIQETKKAFDKSPEKADMFSFLQEAALEYDPADVATIFLSVQNGLMFRATPINKDEFGMSDLALPPEAYEIVILDGSNLGNWIDENGDVLLEHINDYASHSDEPGHDEIDLFSEETVKAILKTCPEPKDKENILQSKAFVEGFLTAAINARTLTSKDANGNFSNAAVEAGWDAWRQSKSIEGNSAFHKAISEGKPRKEAIKAFWQIANKAARREAIVKLDKTGLTLKSGRHVSWSIAVLKIKNDELAFTGDEKERIKTALLKANIGMAFANLL